MGPTFCSDTIFCSVFLSRVDICLIYPPGGLIYTFGMITSLYYYPHLLHVRCCTEHVDIDIDIFSSSSDTYLCYSHLFLMSDTRSLMYSNLVIFALSLLYMGNWRAS